MKKEIKTTLIATIIILSSMFVIVWYNVYKK